MMFRIGGYLLGDDHNSMGKTLSILFQGCLHHCKGCGSTHLWAMYGGDKMDTDYFKKLMMNDLSIQGLLLSGGEPFLQPQAALDLAAFAKSNEIGIPVWCRTGYLWEDILQWEDNRKRLLQTVDVLIDGRYEENLKTQSSALKTSSNMRVIDVKKSLETGTVVTMNG